MSNYEERKQILINNLQLAGVKFRDDSALCQKYMHGDKTHSLEFIVNRMCQMKYLYNYCNMQMYRDKAYQEIYDEFQDYNEYDYDADAWDCFYTVGMVSSRAEAEALQKHSNCRYPDVFPWQLPNNMETLQLAIDYNNEIWVKKILQSCCEKKWDLSALSLAFSSKQIRKIILNECKK